MSTDTLAAPDVRGLQDQLWTAVTSRDEHAAAAVLFTALDAGIDPETALLDVIALVQARVGTEWAANRLSVAQEHAASAIAERVIA
ncbi:B12-binding domain-containing protein, partial [Streptomyces sp. NPDC012486]|uniref:B12-binding domain-containing protein n=1 Tax=Streptomyces sp. NPDC012486 TaxID=3156669 RepID=UPI0033C311FF